MRNPKRKGGDTKIVSVSSQLGIIIGLNYPAINLGGVANVSF